MKVSESYPTSRLSSFRLRLQTELAARCATNMQYSQRSFAQHLDIDHSTLSQFLRGKRKLTEATIQKLGSALKLSPEEIDSYVAHHRRWPVADSRINEAKHLTRDAAEMIADWYYLRDPGADAPGALPGQLLVGRARTGNNRGRSQHRARSAVSSGSNLIGRRSLGRSFGRAGRLHGGFYTGHHR